MMHGLQTQKNGDKHMAPEWYNQAMVEYENGLLIDSESEGAGYFDSEGDYIPGPDDFAGEDDYDEDDEWDEDE
jgi:hypothetical protein